MRLTRERTKTDFSQAHAKIIGELTIRSDLEDIRSRLAVMETTMEMMAKEGKNSTTEDNVTRRTLRSQQ
jgi:hypothetical protein